MLKLFVDLSTADDKYFLVNRDNLTQPIPILVPQEEKTFSQFFSYCLKSTINLEHFQKKNTLIVVVFPKLPTPQKVIR